MFLAPPYLHPYLPSLLPRCLPPKLHTSLFSFTRTPARRFAVSARRFAIPGGCSCRHCGYMSSDSDCRHCGLSFLPPLKRVIFPGIGLASLSWPGCPDPQHDLVNMFDPPAKVGGLLLDLAQAPKAFVLDPRAFAFEGWDNLERD